MDSETGTGAETDTVSVPFSVRKTAPLGEVALPFKAVDA